MTRASGLFSPEERQRIEAAIAGAEQGTGGEIVPVVATASGRYDRGEDLFGLVCAVVALVVAWWRFQGIAVGESEWAATSTLGLGLLPVVLIVVAGFLGGAVAATFVPALKLPFVSRAEMAEEVERSAAAAFQRLRVRRTAAGTGILIYVSLYERMVRVLGDEVVATKVAPADWEAVCQVVVGGLRDGRAASGLIDGIRKAGELLAHHFPPPPGDRNELVDQLHLID